MSVGNLKDQGNKGNNFPWQLNVLKTLGLIAGSTAAGATEATALAILASIQNGKEFEQNLVIDTGGVGCPSNCPTYLQIRIYNTETHIFDAPIYFDASGALVTPVGPLELVNPQLVLNNILTQVSSTNSKTPVLGQATMANSVPVVVSSNQSTLPISAASLPLPTGSATATNQATEITALNQIHSDLIASLPAGTNIIGKVAIDQSVPGTTNKVDIGTNGQVTINGLTYPVSTGNSTVAQLAAGAIFNGAVESIQNQQALQISLLSDQPVLVKIISYADAAGTQIVDNTSCIFFVEKNGKLNKNIQLPADYFNVQITNQGIATTTTLNCDVTFGIMTSVPSVNLSMPNLGVDEGLPTRSIPQSIFRTTFAKTLASTWDTDFWTRISLGSGMANSQSSGNGIITTGTTVNAETILRSNKSFRGSFRLKEKTILSQRIVNQQFFVEVVDVIGDALAITISSATAVVVTIPNNTFTSENVGQSMYLGAYSGTGTFIPGRYAIASVAGNNVTFTVAGFAVGSGTCSAFGWNYHHVIYDTATVTNAKYDSQRHGWATGDSTITINTTVSPGHLLTMKSEDGEADVMDQLVASATTLPALVRGTRVENICSETTQLWIQIRAVNGSVAPASTTTWTIGMIAMENYASQPISINGTRTQGVGTQLPVRIDNTPAVTITSGTVTTVTAVTNLNGGQTAHSAAATGNPLRIGGKVAPTTIATQDLTLVAGDACDVFVTSAGQAIIKPFSTSELDYTFNISTAVTVTSLLQLVPASGTASVRNYLTGLMLQSDTLGAAGNAWILDGQGAIGTSVTIATPGVFTSSAHDLKVGDAIVFTSLGTITGVTVNTVYYITATSFAATTFTVATTLGGTAIQITGSTSAFTFYRVLYALRLQTTAIETPAVINFPTPLKGISNGAINLLIPSSLTSGNIYLTPNGYRGF